MGLVGLLSEAGFDVGYVAIAKEIAVDFDGLDDAFVDLHFGFDFAKGEAVLFGDVGFG